MNKCRHEDQQSKYHPGELIAQDVSEANICYKSEPATCTNTDTPGQDCVDLVSGRFDMKYPARLAGPPTIDSKITVKINEKRE